MRALFVFHPRYRGTPPKFLRRGIRNTHLSVWLLPPQVFPCGSWWIAEYVISPKMPESPHANVTQVAIPRRPYRLLLPMPTILTPCTRGTGNITGIPRWGAKRAEKRGNRRLGRLPMRNGSRPGKAHPCESANSCISKIHHTGPGDEKPPFAETFCGIVSLVMLVGLKALSYLT
jgi:hypothetical protein